MYTVVVARKATKFAPGEPLFIGHYLVKELGPQDAVTNWSVRFTKFPIWRLPSALLYARRQRRAGYAVSTHWRRVPPPARVKVAS